VLDHLGRTTLRIPYPWVDGEAHVVRVLTSTGTAFEHEIAVAVGTPTPSARFLGVFTLIGLYVGVIPVIIGLLWFPFLKRLPVRAMDFLLALTVGLLAFLLVDGASEGLEAAELLPESYQGVVLFALTAAGAYLLLEGVGAWLRGRRSTAATGRRGWVLAVLIAVGIGLHNFGEGLAVGSAFALGEAALGTLLIVGFTLHNTTEGLAIVAPLARDDQPVSVGELVKLGLIGGVPTVAGAWLGGFVYSPVWSVLFLAVGVGAIAQVIGQIVRHMTHEGSVARALATGPVLAGLFAGFAVMYITGMLVG
jgi:zinc transporter ZupT